MWGMVDVGVGGLWMVEMVDVGDGVCVGGWWCDVWGMWVWHICSQYTYQDPR